MQQPDSFTLYAASLLLLASCGGSQSDTDTPATAPPQATPAAAPAPAPAPATEPVGATGTALTSIAANGIDQLFRLEDVFLSSQPSRKGFEVLKRQGIHTIVNLRKPNELGEIDEGESLARLEFSYHNPAFGPPEELTDELLDTTRALFSNAEERPLLVHCKSGTRVGAVWMAHRILDAGIPWIDAGQEARLLGLKQGGYLERVREYVTARGAEAPPAAAPATPDQPPAAQEGGADAPAPATPPSDGR